MANLVVHFEIYVDDINRAIKFYTKLFGWKIAKFKTMDYWLVYPTGVEEPGPAKFGINGGMLLRPGPKPENDKATPNAFVCTVSVDDIDAILEKVEGLGGRIDIPVDTVKGVGRLAYIRDSEGNLVGLLKPIM